MKTCIHIILSMCIFYFRGLCTQDTVLKSETNAKRNSNLIRNRSNHIRSRTLYGSPRVVNDSVHKESRGVNTAGVQLNYQNITASRSRNRRQTQQLTNTIGSIGTKGKRATLKINRRSQAKQGNVHRESKGVHIPSRKSSKQHINDGKGQNAGTQAVGGQGSENISGAGTGHLSGRNTGHISGHSRSGSRPFVSSTRQVSKSGTGKVSSTKQVSKSGTGKRALDSRQLTVPYLVGVLMCEQKCHTMTGCYKPVFNPDTLLCSLQMSGTLPEYNGAACKMWQREVLRRDFQIVCVDVRKKTRRCETPLLIVSNHAVDGKYIALYHMLDHVNGEMRLIGQSEGKVECVALMMNKMFRCESGGIFESFLLVNGRIGKGKMISRLFCNAIIAEDKNPNLFYIRRDQLYKHNIKTNRAAQWPLPSSFKNCDIVFSTGKVRYMFYLYVVGGNMVIRYMATQKKYTILMSSALIQQFCAFGRFKLYHTTIYNPSQLNKVTTYKQTRTSLQLKTVNSLKWKHNISRFILTSRSEIILFHKRKFTTVKRILTGKKFKEVMTGELYLLDTDDVQVYRFD